MDDVTEGRMFKRQRQGIHEVGSGGHRNKTRQGGAQGRCTNREEEARNNLPEIGNTKALAIPPSPAIAGDDIDNDDNIESHTEESVRLLKQERRELTMNNKDNIESYTEESVPLSKQERRELTMNNKDNIESHTEESVRLSKQDLVSC
ncbi:hypothetical protein BGX38DRAFT_1273259 [Terfezia claveryi]|nr:hypothetical protein BGX38DRAFT_1273259 [Terfezia claveryi]